MLRHADIWNAIDRLAQDTGLTASGLARRSGLDPTTFNKSKRVTRNGKARWPSTESLAKMLEATGASLEQFLGYIIDPDRSQRGASAQMVPLIGLAQVPEADHFDAAGHPVGSGWDEIPFPDLNDPHAYALEVSGDGLAPVYRDGDRLVVSPGGGGIRRGDRVVVRLIGGDVMVMDLMRRTARRLELRTLDARAGRTVDLADVAWIARVVWVGQ